jgi:Ni/Co efflux regulator RcnB
MKKILITVLFAAALSGFVTAAAADEREDSYEDRKKEAKERAESADVKERAESADVQERAEDLDAGDAVEAGQNRRQDRRRDR